REKHAVRKIAVNRSRLAARSVRRIRRCSGCRRPKPAQVVAAPPPQYAPGTQFAPQSNLLLGRDVGRKVHTNLEVVAGPRTKPAVITGEPPYAGYLYETPASLACIYALVAAKVPGCNPNLNFTRLDAGSRSIAIVVAYDYPAALSDLKT